jgi:hypothetical protein
MSLRLNILYICLTCTCVHGYRTTYCNYPVYAFLQFTFHSMHHTRKEIIICTFVMIVIFNKSIHPSKLAKFFKEPTHKYQFK